MLALIIQIPGYECEVERYARIPTITTNIIFKNREMTEENIREAEKELDENTLNLEAAQIVEERKSLQWLKDEMRRVNESGN